MILAFYFNVYKHKRKLHKITNEINTKWNTDYIKPQTTSDHSKQEKAIPYVTQQADVHGSWWDLEGNWNQQQQIFAPNRLTEIR